MQTIRPVLIGVMVITLVLIAKDSDARRFGAKSSSSSSASVAKVEPRKNAEVTTSSALRYGAAAAVGGAAGGAAAKAMMDSDQEDKGKSPADLAATAEAQRLEKLSELEQKARAEDIEKKTEQILKSTESRRKAELAAKEAEEKRRKDEANMQRAAAEERQAELRRVAIAREMSCIIKPTMTDAEINHCKWAWSSPRP